MVPKLEEDIKSAQSELTEVSTKGRQLNEVVSKIRNKFSEAQSAMTTNRSRNRVLSFIMQLKTEGKAPGVYGRLGDLGEWLSYSYYLVFSGKLIIEYDFILEAN